MDRKRRDAECYTVQVRAAKLPSGGRHVTPVGEWLSLVEHLVRDQGVGGSNPLSPTNYRNPIIELARLLFRSLRQLGSIKQFLDLMYRCLRIRRD